VIVSTLLALAVQTSPTPDAGTPEEREIVVIGRQLRDWRGTWRLRSGKVACKTVTSTGDAEIDRIGCQAMINCIEPKVAAITAITAEKKDRATVQTRINEVIQGQMTCLETERNQGIDTLAAARVKGAK
jgi:hypothetical protein